MIRYTNVETSSETASEKRIRIFLAIMFFIQVILTTTPYMHRIVETAEGEELETVTARQMVLPVFTEGFNEKTTFLFLYGAVFILLPAVAFFFCVLDKRSRLKYLFSAVCAVLCAVLITFGFAGSISLGAIITLVLNVVCLFMTMQGLQATNLRRNG